MKSFLIFLFVLCFSVSAKADFDCTVKPTCESLGYVSEELSDCYNQIVLRCPFDSKYVFCGESTVELNCRLGDYFDVQSHLCYKDEADSDYVFIKYNTSKTKAYLLDLTKHVHVNNSGDVETGYYSLLEDESGTLLTRKMLEDLLGLADVSYLPDGCYRVRNAQANEIVAVENGAILETLTATSYAGYHCSGVHAHYYVKANLYRK